MPRFVLLLCSASPRRATLLQKLEAPFQVLPVDVTETPLPGENPWNTARRLALSKLRAARTEQPERYLLTADTVVDLDGRPIGKPVSGEEAVRTLQALAGRPHLVHTAVALSSPGFLGVVTCTTEVEMRPYTAREIEDSVASGEPMDKAGAYAIQDPVFRPVCRIRGSYSTVVGLPLAPTARLLRERSVAISAEVLRRAVKDEERAFREVARAG
ncbi:MAG: Maf family protein [Chloroflexota bacterium]|nr:Maf family protein [Chloroflexota bacterium]